MDDILKDYAYHKPSDEGLADIRQLRKGFSELHNAIIMICPDSRERAVALTKLQTAAMWAIRSRVINDPASEVQS